MWWHWPQASFSHNCRMAAVPAITSRCNNIGAVSSGLVHLYFFLRVTVACVPMLSTPHPTDSPPYLFGQSEHLSMPQLTLDEGKWVYHNYLRLIRILQLGLELMPALLKHKTTQRRVNTQPKSNSVKGTYGIGEFLLGH